ETSRSVPYRSNATASKPGSMRWSIDSARSTPEVTMVPAHARNAAELAARYHRDAAAAEQDPAAFWAEQARALKWARPFGQVLNQSNAPFFRWSEGGKLNIVASAVDRHAEGPRRDKPAFVWLSEDLKTREAVSY